MEELGRGSSVGVLVAMAWFATGPVVALDVVGLLFWPLPIAEEAGNHGCLRSGLGYLAGQEGVRFARASLIGLASGETSTESAIPFAR